ncbi:hypothetical protein ES695_19490 [Candidatus Atribacteria bacterium 1244-E10-H5-B2]|nr:MAG: hypothetical protein ES695_19490 [Candidatus Atribacteria bacterium 1244-E10-H5-B2]
MMEEYIDLCHFQTQEKITVLAKRTGKEGQYLTSCINPDHEDVHPSMGINVIKGEYNCISRHDAKGVTWERHIRELGNSKSYKKKSNRDYTLEGENKEIKSDILQGIDTDINNWEGYDLKAKEEIKSRIPFDICRLEEEEQTVAMGSVVKAKIFRITALRDRVKITKNLIKNVTKDIKSKYEKEKKVLTKGCPENLINLIKINNKVHYLFDKDGKLYSTETVDIEERTYKAKQDLLLNYITKSIFDVDRNKVDFEELLKDVEKFIRRHVEMPNEHDYFLLALWVFHTYMIDLEQVTPFLFFQGEYSTGKSQAGDVLRHIAYKAELQTDLTPATMFRSAQYYKTTLVVDELTLVGRNANPDIISLIKCRYERMSAVPRIDMEDKDRENQIKYYQVFGPLAMGSELGLPTAIKSRSIHFIMKQNIREAVETMIRENEKSLKTAEELRNKLTILRATLLNRWKRKELKKLKHFARRRLGQILKPLYRVVMEIVPSREKEFLETVKLLAKKAKKIKQTSLQADVVKILLDYVEDGKDFIGSLDCCGLLNEERSESVKTNTMGLHYVMESLGFESATVGKKGYLINKELLKDLKEQYI